MVIYPYEEVHFVVLNRQVKILKDKEVLSMKMSLRNHLVEGARL